MLIFLLKFKIFSDILSYIMGIVEELVREVGDGVGTGVEGIVYGEIVDFFSFLIIEFRDIESKIDRNSRKNR